MGKPVSSKVERVETTVLNTKINKEVYENFKDCCAYLGYPMNVLLETFMQQYIDGKFNLSNEEIIRWKKDDSEMDVLNTTFNKEVYTNFKSYCKGNGYFVKHVVTAFMESYTNRKFILEFVEVKED